jgi:hypothetical protein
MTANESFDRRLAGWLESEAQGRVADHLAEVLVVTRATRQRPGWASLERWLPVTSVAQRRFGLPRPLLLFVILAALVMAMVGAWMLGPGHSQPPAGRLVENGRIYYVDGLGLYSVAHDGSDLRLVDTNPGVAYPVVSPDGRSIAYTTSTSSELRIASLGPSGDVSGPAMLVRDEALGGYGEVAWDPGSRRLAFVSGRDGSDHLFVADADGRNIHEIGADFIPSGMVVTRTAWSPNGQWIGFILLRDGEPGTVEIVHPDGTGHRTLPTGQVASDNLGYLAWSPDPGTERIMYMAGSRGIRYFDLATNGEVAVRGGFWPAWSPNGDRIAYWTDGTKIIPTPVPNAAAATPSELFPSFSGGCPDHPELNRKALCGPPIWSPDGSWVMAIDVSFTALMAFPSEGAGDPIVIPLNTQADVSGGRFFAWQPIYR